MEPIEFAFNDFRMELFQVLGTLIVVLAVATYYLRSIRNEIRKLNRAA